MPQLVLLSLALAQAPAAPAAPGQDPSAGGSAPVPPGGPVEEEELGVIPGLPPGPRPPIEEVSRLTYAIGSRLRCPVCQGLSVADSTSPAAVQMQKRVRELVTAGYAEDQIRDFFVERYGEWILLDPPADRRNLLIYVVPGLGLGFGLAWAARTALQFRREPDDELPSDRGQLPKDRYEERLLAELED